MDPASTSAVPAGAQPPRPRRPPSRSPSKQPLPPASKPSPPPPSRTLKQSPPPPSRTLKQPMTLRVTEASEAEAGAGDKAELRRAFEKRVQYARRAEKWADRAMEQVLDRDTFVKALSYLHCASYLEVQHERHLNGLCAYTPCGRGPAAAYRSGKRFVVSTASRTITEKDGNDDQAFCGRKCAARSWYVLQQLGTAAAWLGPGEKVTLLEEKEDNGEVVWGGKKGDVMSWVKREEEKKKREEEEEEEEKKEETGVGALLAGLTIVERATPKTPPAAPRLNVPSLPVLPGVPVAVSGSGQLAGLPLPLPGGEVQVSSPLFSKNSSLLSKEELANSAAVSRRAGSSLLSTEHAGLATSVINASRKMAVVEPSDDSEEEEEEWAKAMGWGSGPEVDALFAVAAESRKLMQDSEGTAEQSTPAAASGQ
ncbi:uncharacterized protein CcaverHIS019_0309440 [Cutaneotrichosporon cavernicola]|uniref:RNA polymerase II subunit B1 CTD phosphatase RPAP2 homolog n=1 Tax=Cutaneotrichosporon cavernicola TaxID=279322 RepID=A0AA48KZS8_9TREE|nr:uncharacterized protein CcaverHIS019_0309440 [Cutaneotrichosporon cavernicola]BEI90874.1 hypothetical protein CcaverHIS019_0309440 [Cutaneotrichosporon cavernicola]